MDADAAGAEGAAPKIVEFYRNALYPRQDAAIYDPHRYSIIEASTKSGKTAGCILWIAEKAVLGKRGQNFWWVAPQFGQAKIAFRRLVAGLNPEAYTKNETELTITFRAIGTTLWFKSADNPDALYGEDVFAAVIDEASRMKEEAWHAIRSTLTATRGPVRIIGNVKGRKNWFFKLARMAATGASPDMAYHRLTWQDAVDAQILDKAEIEDARRLLPEGVFRQLYEAEPAEDEGNPFGIDAIRRCVSATSGLGNGPVICWGWDFAKSVDWTVGVGLNGRGSVAGFDRFQKPWPITYDRIAAVTKCAALGDSTGIGDPIIAELQRRRVPIDGFTFTANSKQQLMEGLATAIQQGLISIPANSPIVDELECFEYEYTRSGVRYSAPEGMHDDCVCALALAVQHWQSGYAQPAAASSIHIGRDLGDMALSLARGSGCQIVE